MNVFISGPALTSAENSAQCVWDWVDGRTPWFFFLFCFVCLFAFKDFEAENQKKKNETQNSH